MSTPAITVENLSKAYRIGLKEEIPDTITGALMGWAKSPFRNLQNLRKLDTFSHNGDSDDILWALKDVSFEVQEGEVIGIIGRNGAGKSTLLKVLSRITEPTSGRATIRGRVSSLLEVGTGFHPEMTGRENVYMNGTILGMRKKEIDRKFDEIVDFSGVEKFLDTPIKRYSSGMKVRLAFAVAAHLEPEILIIDEVLAVGDAEFQKKCLGKMKDIAGGGRTVLFVSHNMPAVRTLTQRGIYLRDGKLEFMGQTNSTIDYYLSESIRIASKEGIQNLDYYRRSISKDSPIQFRRMWFEPGISTDSQIPTITSGDPIRIYLELSSTISLADACLSITIIGNHEQRVATFFSKDTSFRISFVPGTQVFCCSIEALPLSPGLYTLDCGVNKNALGTAFDVLLDYPVFEVEIPEIRTGELDWPTRPWGSVHWKKVVWQQV